MNLVQRVGVELVEVRAALRILEWNVVGDHSDVACAACFVTSEHIKVCGVHGRIHRDKRGFAVARRHGGVTPGERNGTRQCGDCKQAAGGRGMKKIHGYLQNMVMGQSIVVASVFSDCTAG